MLSNFFAELKLRNVRKTMTIYLSSALTTIGVMKLFTEVYDLPDAMFKIVAVLMTCGAASAFTVAWYHGGEGTQRPRKKEFVLHSLVLVAAVLLSFRVTGSQKAISRMPDSRTIAVLPFKNLSDSKEDEYFSDGITEDILTQLSKINDLRVISRTSVMKYKERTKTIPEIAEELGVGTILEGSVRRVGNRIRIVGQLIDAQSDEHLWAETYDREMADVFSIQSDVAQRIGAALKARLLPVEKQLIEKKATENLDAYAYYLRGREHYYRLTKDDNERAVGFFKKAIALDSAYALAFTGLADAYAQRVQRYGFPADWADSSIALSKHAIELDQDLAEAYKSLGLAYYQREWYRSAIEQYEKALTLNPNYASVYANMGEIKLWTGHQDEAIRLVKKAIALSPGRASFYSMLGNAYAELEMDSMALSWFERAIELQPSLTQLYVGLGELYLAQRNILKARGVLGPAIAREPDVPLLLTTAGKIELYDKKYDVANTFFRNAYENLDDKSEVLIQLAFTLVKTGKKDDAQLFLDQAHKKAQRDLAALSEEGTRRYELACIWAIRNNPMEALRWLNEAVRLGSRSYRLTVQDPLLENLHANEEFKRVMAQVKSRADLLRTSVLEQQQDLP